MKKYDNMADFFIATLDNEDLKNRLLSCKTTDKMYEFVSECCSDKFSKEEFEIFISRMIKNHFIDKKIPNNILQKISGGGGEKNGGSEEKGNSEASDKKGILGLKQNVGKDKRPVSILHALGIIGANESTPSFINNSYRLSKGLFILYSNLKDNMENEELEMLKDELYDLNCRIQELEKNKK